MKKIILFLILISCYSDTYAQFKISLSYQTDRHKANYVDRFPFSPSQVLRPKNHYGNTIQANAIWDLTEHFSIYTGFGYSSKHFKPWIESQIIFADPSIIPEVTISKFLVEYDIHNIEIPFGVKWNFVNYKNLGVGLLGRVIPAFTVESTENYQIQFFESVETFKSSEWILYGIRFDVGIDIEYHIDKKLAVFTSLYWSPFDWRYADRSNDTIDGEPILLSRTMQIQNGQQGLQFGVTRSF